MAKNLLKAAAIINFICIVLIGLFCASLGNFFAIIGIVIFFIPFVLMLISGIMFFSYISEDNESFVKHKTSVLIWGIVLLIFSTISGILALVAYSEMDFNKIKAHEETKKFEEPVDKETKKLDMLLKLGVLLVTLAGIMFATSSWNILSGVIKTVGLLIFSSIFFLLSVFVGKRLKIRRSEITYYILGIFFFMFSFVSVGYFGIFGTWFSFIGEGCNILMSLIFAVLAVLLIISLKKYKQTKLLHLIYGSALLSVTYLFLQFGIDIKFIILAWSILALALSINRNDINIFTRVLNDFGKILIIALLFTLFVMIKKEELMWINILSGGILIVASYLQALLKNNSPYKIVSSILFILFGIYCVFLYNLPHDVRLILNSSIVAIAYIIAYIKRDDESLFVSTFWVTALAFFCCYSSALDYHEYYIAFLISALFVLFNIINMFGRQPKHILFESYSQPVKLILFINALALLISNYVSNLRGSILLLSIGVVFVMGYFIQNNNKLKNIYYIGSLVAVLIYYIDGFYSSGFFNSFITGLITILTLAILTEIAFKSEDYKYKLKETLFLLTSLITFANIILITLSYDILLLGIIISFILFVMLAVVLITSRYLFGISLIMVGFTLSILFRNLLNLPNDVNIILQSTIAFVAVFIFIHAILGDASQKVKSVLETIAISIIFLSFIFNNSWVIGLYIGVITILFILIGISNKFNSYYYTGIIFAIANIIVQLRSYWESIPIWAYILIGGLVLIGVVTYKEYRKIKPKIQETEELKEEETKELKNVSSEVVIISVLLLVVSIVHVSAIFTKVNHKTKLDFNLSIIENY